VAKEVFLSPKLSLKEELQAGVTGAQIIDSPSYPLIVVEGERFTPSFSVQYQKQNS